MPDGKKMASWKETGKVTDMKVLILGVTGMLGHTVFKTLRKSSCMEVFATARSSAGFSQWFSDEEIRQIHTGVDANDVKTIERTLLEVQPDCVINCIGLIKQSSLANDPLTAITINSLLPHQIAQACVASKTRMIHISTDCVFNGEKGNYTEQDPSDATDLYGRSKFLGEVAYPHCVTLRTSIIGHELKEKLGLVEWFLSQDDHVRGYTRAFFSGFPTIEIARIISQYVLPNPNLSGLYQVAADSISKYELLKLIAEEYDKEIELQQFPEFIIDRSLCAKRFNEATGYCPPQWPELIKNMHQHYLSEFCYRQ